MNYKEMSKAQILIEITKLSEKLNEREKNTQNSSFSNKIEEYKEEESLKERDARNQRYRMLIESIDAGYAHCKVVVNTQNQPIDYIYLEVNKKLEEMRQLSKEQLIGKRATELLPTLSHDSYGWIEKYGNVGLTGVPLQYDSFSESKNRYYHGHVYSSEPGYFDVLVFDDTDKKRNEVHHKESEEQFRSLFDSATDGILVADPESRKLYLGNKTICQMSGYTLDEIKNLGIADIYPKEIQPEILAEFEKLVQGERTQVEIPVKRKDGSIFYADVNRFTITVSGKIYVAGFFRDITERKRVDHQLHKDVDRTNFLFELYKNGYKMSSQEIYKYILDQAISLTDSLIGFLHFVTEDQKNIILTSWNQEALKTCKATFDTHYPFEKAGNWVDCVRFKKPVIYNDYPNSPNQKGLPVGHTPLRRFMSIPVMDGDKIKMIFGVGNKIDEYNNFDIIQIQLIANELTKILKERNLDKLLKESEDQFRSIFDGATDGILVADSESRKLYLGNKTFCQMSGYTLEEIKNLGIADIYPKEIQPNVLAEFEKLVQGERTQVEIPVKRKDESIFYADVNRFSIIVGGKTYVAGFFRDVTERKNIEQKMKKIVEELGRSNAELEQFAYIASHDLQEPLRTVGNFMQLLELHAKDTLDQKSRDYIKSAVKGSQRMQKMINDLLVFSRVGTRGKEFKLTESNQILKQALANLHMTIKETKPIITYDELPSIMVDDTQFELLFQNLIGNAIKFRTEQTPQIHIGVKNEGINWVFWVKDNGIGIDPKYFGQIFTIFQRLNERDKYPGNGIGLAMCKKIVERHGGHIWIESELGKGTIVYFKIPK